MARRFVKEIDVDEVDSFKEFQDKLREFVGYDTWTTPGSETSFQRASREVFEAPAIVGTYQVGERVPKWKKLKRQSGYDEDELRTIKMIENKLERTEKDKSGDFWSSTEEEYLEKTYGYMPTRELAETLNRTPSAIYHKADAMGLEARARQERNWTAAEEEVLKEQYGQISTEELADELGRTKDAIWSKVQRMREAGEM